MALKGAIEKMMMSDGAQIGVYRVHAAGARRGGLVLIQEIFGVTEHIMELCDGYAADGYEVLAPALYDREHPNFQASYSPEDIQVAIKLARAEHPFDLSIADTQTCIDDLKARGPVFITGYCYGGSVTWAAAGRCTGLAAAAGYYGGTIGSMIELEPKCPTILHFGEKDHGIPMEVVQKVAAAHPKVQVYLYDAGHGFNSDRRTDFDAHSAALARTRTLELFRANGG